MSTATAQLLSQFEALAGDEKQEFIRALIRRLPAWDLGRLDDGLVAAAGDELAQMLDQEERGSKAR